MKEPIISGVMLAMACALVSPVAGEEQTAGDSLRSGEMVFVETGESGLYLDKFEVTNEEYAAFLNEIGNRREEGAYWIELSSQYALIEQTEKGFAARKGFEQHPAIEVSWHGARAYCAWLGKRLPTQDEWQRACEGEQGLKYPWGQVFSPGKANVFGDQDGYVRTAPVGSFPEGASPCGALDMAGNVWEWTAAAEGELPYLRGGSWVNGPTLAQCAKRANTRDSHSYIKGNTIGFRCAR